MIVDVPSYNDLNQTATGWLNLSWDIAVNSVHAFNDLNAYLSELTEFEPAVIDQHKDNFWKERLYNLNNAVSLLHTSVEMFLKSRIAEVSPYLLIAGEAGSWPSTDSSGACSFHDFRTMDATHLCRAVNIVCSLPLPKDFPQFFERIRKHRNRIAHLNAGNFPVTAKGLLIDILTAYHFLFPNNKWTEFRREYLSSTENYSEIDFYSDDPSHSNFCYEMRAVIDILEPRFVKAFFHYNKKKRGMRCPECLNSRMKHDDTEWGFAQTTSDGTAIKCIACDTTFSISEYSQGLKKFDRPPTNGDDF